MGVAIDWAALRMLRSAEFWRMAVLWTLALLYSYFLLFVADVRALLRRSPRPSRSNFHAPSMSPGQPPVCVITGASSGLGAATARALAGEGYYVILAGRSLEKLYETMQGIMRQNSVAQLKVFHVDLLSFKSIMEFKESIQEWLRKSNLHPSVQLLVNNAGILAASSRITADGCDQMLETNYMSAFALTNLLLPLLKNSPVPARVVNITSFTHRCVYHVPIIIEQNLKCLSCSENYPLAHIYEYSKYYLLLFTYELHRKLYSSSPSVSFIAADPGVVETNIMRELPQHISQFAFLVLRFLCLLQSPKDGVASIVDAALAPPEMSGRYFFGGNGRTIGSSALSHNNELAEKLWDTSVRWFQEAMLNNSSSMKDLTSCEAESSDSNEN